MKGIQLTMKKPRLQLNIAITKFTPLMTPRVKYEPCKIFGQKQVLIKEDEQELEQFYLELKHFPVEEQAVNAAFDQLKAMTKEHMIKLGLMK